MQKDISFGEWVRQRRHILDLTQQELADQVGCARITLRRIESGALKPSKELAQILLEKLGAPSTEREAWLGFARGLSGFPERSVDSSVSRSLTNLPTSLNTFIGREKEQDEVIHLIERNRLVTIAGVGGIGKTRLVHQVGQKLLNAYANGVWFISFDSLSDPTLVAQTVASVFDIREGSSEQPLLERLTYSLSQKIALLIFDNCEHLLDACAQLTKTLLTNCPNLKVLATSREVLNLEGEATYYLPSLSTPDDPTPFETLTDYESIRLFAERASLALSSFRLTKENAQPILGICRRVDGIPLAIELAAARVDILQPKEILKQLSNSFALLASGSRVMLPRHQTVHTSMDWSWGLLAEAEQIFLRQLSVFAGGWTLESAQAVCDGDVLSLTSALVKKSLVMVDQKSDGETRYHFHEIVRQYMRKKLIESGEKENTRTRHLEFFLKFTEQAELALKGPTQIEWMSRLNDEQDNIRAALEWADKSDVEAGLYVAGRLYVFWENFDVREGMRWLEGFIQKPESKVYPHARANALCTLGQFLLWSQRFAEAHTMAQECLDLYRACGDKYGEVDGLLLLAGIENPAQAMEFNQQALVLARSINDKWRTGFALYSMGWGQGDRYSYVERALTLLQEVGDLRYMAECLSELGRLEMLNNNIESAEKMLNEAAPLFRQLNIKSGMSGVLQSYGRIAALKGDYEQAYTNLQEAATIAEKYGYGIHHLFARSLLGYLAWYRGDITEAHEIFTETMQSFFKKKNEIGVVFNLEGMAALFVAVGKPEIASKLIGWADSMREKIGDPRPSLEQADVDKIIAACLAKMGEVAFSNAYDEGAKMTLNEAVDLALNTS